MMIRLAATACLLFAALLLPCAEGATEDDTLGLTPGGPGGWGFYPAQKSDPALPRVLLIGDSIVNGYRGTVIRELKGKANVDVWLTPAAENDPKLLNTLHQVLTHGPYTIVHFNIGLHGWPAGRIPEGQYEPLMKAYVAALREGAPISTLIWASSTPITVQGKPTEPDPVNNPTITRRNALAAQIMADNHIAIDDLATLMAPNLKLALGDKFHWSAAGTELQGKAVAAVLLKSLPAPEPAPPQTADPSLPHPPPVVKKGTIDLDLCETSPFVFKGKPYRLEWHRKAGRLRIMDHDTQTEISNFGAKHRFPCVFVEGDNVYVIGTKEDRGWFGNTLSVFTSTDLHEWKEQVAFTDKDYGICNTSVCKAGDRYVMSIEVNSASKDTNGTFACRFLESKDLIHWTLTPLECRHGFDRGLSSPHLLRWLDGWFYLFSTISGHPKGYVLMLDRSRDLKQWEPSPFNPVMVPGDGDKIIANPKLTPEQRDTIAKARNRDNSDIDFCDFNGGLIINYCWGNQTGNEFIAEASFAGTTAQYLEAWFPNERLWRGIDITRPLSTFAKDRATYGRVLSAEGATMTVSSGKMQGNSLLLGDGPAFAFHTDAERNPWMTIDLGVEKELTGVFIRNRTDTAQERAATLHLQVSNDGREWREVWQATGAEPLWEIPLKEKSIHARYVRLETRPANPTPLHLQHVEVWGK